jgi:hypothetical protein
MKRSYWLLIYPFAVLLFTLFAACSNKDSKQSATTVLENYYSVLNARDFEKALDYEVSNNDRLQSLNSLKEIDASYRDLKISRYTTSNNQIPIDDGGDIIGTCERYTVSGKVEYPSGWGADPSGDFSLLFTMIMKEGRWLIFESGTFTKDSCLRAGKVLEETNSE